jgi:hypothetical protein
MKLSKMELTTMSGTARLSQIICLATLLISAVHAADEKPPQPVTVKFRIVGLYSTERQEDLREAAKKMTDIALTEFDYASGEGTFTYDSSKILKNAKPEQVQNHIDSALRNVSNRTFGVKPLSTIPREKLQRVDIKVEVLDCKACGFGLYNMVSSAPGVEQAFANYKEGIVVAWVDPEKTDKAKLVDVLKKREVQVKEDAPAAPEKK